MFNLGTVIKFEVIRALKKPTFWIAIFSVPIVYLAFFGLGQMAGQSAKESIEKQAKEEFSFEVMDESGILSEPFVVSAGGKISKNREASIENVKKEKINAFYHIPKNLEKEKVEIFSVHTNVTEFGKYPAVIETLLKNASIESVNPNRIAAINSTFQTESTQFKNGEKYSMVGDMIAPGIFLVVFYIVVVFLSNRMLTSTIEEKENRVTEMILTSISAKTLILGKIISIIILGVIQIAALILPAILAYAIEFFVLGNPMNLPEISTFLESLDIKLDATRIAIGALILIAGFLMTTGFIVALGSAMPTAQEAANYFGLVIMFLMAPFFVFPMFTIGETNGIVHFLSYFPLTSPIALLLRNTVGTLSITEALIGVGTLVIFAGIAVWLAVRIFQYGTISYGSKVKLMNIFSKNKA